MLIVKVYTIVMIDCALNMRRPRQQKFGGVKVDRPNLRPAVRKAGTVIDDNFMAELKQLSDKQVKDEMFEEELNQLSIAEAIHGKRELAAFLDPSNPSRSMEQQIGRDLVMRGQEPEFIPADRILGANLSPRGLGIDGEFKPDSEVRRHIRGDINNDGNLEFDRKNVYTEILSPEQIDKVYEAWKPNAFGGNTGRDDFNNAAGEYYGQQGLKLAGYLAVPDDARSFVARKADASISPVGTGRLIENSRTLSGPDIGQSADFRVYDTNQQDVKAVDYQVATIQNDPSLNANVLKNSNLTRADLPQFEREMVRVAQKMQSAGVEPELDLIFSELQKEGILAPTVMRHRDQGTRPGKFMSDAPIMGDVNFDDQHRMAGVMYGLVKPGSHHEKYGMLPEEFRLINSQSLRKHVAGQYAKGEVTVNPFIKDDRRGNLYFNVPLDNTVRPSGLLTANENRQFSQPYTFGDVSDVEPRKLMPGVDVPF